MKLLTGTMDSLPFRFESPCSVEDCLYTAKWKYEGQLLCREHFAKNGPRREKIKQGATKLPLGPRQLKLEEERMTRSYNLACDAAITNRSQGGMRRGNIILRPWKSTGRYPLVDGYITVKLNKISGRMKGRCFIESSSLRPGKLGIVRNQLKHNREWKIGSILTKKTNELYYLMEDEKEILITQREWQDLYYSHYEVLVRDSNEGLRLRNMLYSVKMNIVLSSNEFIPTLDEDDAESYLEETYGTNSFSFEAALYYILIHWYEPERLPWNKK